MADPNDKSLIASSEFDPSGFIKGIDSMTSALEKLSAQEDVIKADLKNINTALVANRAELKSTQDQIAGLDKSSKNYGDSLTKLTTQQNALKDQQVQLKKSIGDQKTALGEVNAAAVKYKDAITNLGAVTKKVADENKGRTLFDVASLNQQVAEVVATGAKLKDVFKGKIPTTELDKFEQSLAGATDEMQQLAQVTTFVKSKLDTLDPNSQEFADLTKIVQTGDKVLEVYGNTVETVDKKSVSLRGRLAALRTQLVELEDQGKENTKEFQDLQIEAGKLQDSIGDAQQRIKVLSSDTKNLDFGIGAIRGVAAAFGLAQGAAALFGVENEEVLKSIQKLTAITAILNGLQEIQTLLQKQSVVAIVGKEIATKGAAIAERIFAVSVGTSTGALKAFRVALLATGIGAFIALIGFAADAMGLFGSSNEDAMTSADDLTAAIKRQDQALEDLNATLDFNSRIRIENLKQSGASEKAIFAEQLKTRQEQLENFKADLKQAQQLQASEAQIRNEMILGGDFSNKQLEKSTENQKLLADDIEKRKAQVLNGERAITLFTEEEETRRLKGQKTGHDNSANLYRSYLERLLTLQRQLRDKTLAGQVQDEAAIREQFTNQINDLTQDIDNDPKLSKKQGTILKKLLGSINKVDLDKALKDFNAQVLKAQEDFENQITSLQIQNATDRANLIRDTLVREAELIQQEAANSADKLIKERDDLIKNITDTPGILPEVKQDDIDRVTLLYGIFLENLATQTTRKQEEITARAFEAAQEQIRTTFTTNQLGVSETATAEIRNVTAQYVQGKIKYDAYQKELTRILTAESNLRIVKSIEENETLLKGVQARILAEQDPERKKALEAEEVSLRNTISDLNRQLAGADAEGVKKDSDQRNQRIQELVQYATAIGSIVNQVVQFWAAANEAEQRSLEKSIALQERRVEAATRVAERGNAEYLRLEEDRLNELQIKQENAARKQLAINAVVQTSQALTAFVTALAQGIATGGPLGGIAIAAAVIGLIASGYAIISSLQKDNAPRFKKGTKSVRRDGQPSGDDTIPAMLTEGEAVIPAGTNKEYKSAVDAIYDKTVPAEDMNKFVNSYRINSRVLPRLDHERMGEVAGVVVAYDGQLLTATESQNKKLEENNELLRIVSKKLSSLGITATIDKNGLAISLMKATEQFSIDKKT